MDSKEPGAAQMEADTYQEAVINSKEAEAAEAETQLKQQPGLEKAQNTKGDIHNGE